MDMQTYCTLDETDRRFDGNRARTHLMTNLGMVLTDADKSLEIGLFFNAWLSERATSLTVHPSGAKFLVPPTWY
jgi:hypothetical protein